LKLKSAGLAAGLAFGALLLPAAFAAAQARGGGDLQQTIHEVASRAVPAIVQLEVTEVFSLPAEQEYRKAGLGSGVIFAVEDGIAFVVTNNHVLGEAGEITVRLAGGESFAGAVQGRDRRRDLAVVRFSAPPDLPTLRLGGSEAARVGDWVLAVGSPLGLNSSVTLGILSAVGRRGGPGGNISDFLQTDAVINPGNSGGALLSLNGQVIGINTWIASDSGSYEGYGFALPSASVQRGVRELLAKGRAADGWLGVSSIDPPPPMREELRLPNGRGALVANYYLGGPAQRAGIQLGDFLVQLDRRRVSEAAGLIQAAADASPHASVRVRLLRRGQPEGLTVVLGERPPEQELAAENARLWPGWIAAGTELVQVFRGTPAARAGFRGNDRIVAVNGKPLAGLAGLFAFLNQALPVYRLTVERGESRLELDLPGQIVNPVP